MFISLLSLLSLQIYSTLHVIFVRNSSALKSFALLIICTFVVGARQIGYDYIPYRKIFETIGFGGAWGNIETSTYLLTSVGYTIYPDPISVFLIYAALTFLVLAIISRSFPIGYSHWICAYVMIAMASGAIVSIRATIASLFVYLFLNYIDKKRFVLSTIMIFTAAFFHMSALIFIPIQVLLKLQKFVQSIFGAMFFQYIIYFIFSIAFLSFISMPVMQTALAGGGDSFLSSASSSIANRIVGYSSEYDQEINLSAIYRAIRDIIFAIASLRILAIFYQNLAERREFDLLAKGAVEFCVIFAFTSILFGKYVFGYRVFELVFPVLTYMIIRMWGEKSLRLPVICISVANAGFIILGYFSTRNFIY